MSALADPTPTLIAVVAVAGFVAGWVDAVVGGGGLIQLPALLLAFPGAAPAQLLATNKLGSIAGTTTASITYYRRVRPDLRTAFPMAALAYLGAVGGAFIGLHIPKSAFNPIILVLLVAVDLFGEAGVAVPVATTGYYVLVAMTVNVDRTPIPNNGKPPLPTLR